MSLIYLRNVDDPDSKPVDDDNPFPVKVVSGVNDPYEAMGYEQVTVATTAIGLTASKFAHLSDVAQAFIRLETAEIRYTIDGTAPTTTVGTPLEISDVLTIAGKMDISRFRAIRTGGTSGVLNVTYEDRMAL